jgi:hypothetical protein
MDLYAQELKVWKECAAYRDSVRGMEASEGVDGAGLGCKVPGAFEW